MTVLLAQKQGPVRSVVGRQADIGRGQARTGSDYIPTLDGWRAIAVAAVIISHAKGTLVWLGWGDNQTLEIASWGRLGVDLFFAISGLLICSRLLHEYSAKDGVSLKGFYLRRSFRILPPYFAYLGILTILGLVAGVPVSRWEVLSCIVFMRNYASLSAGAYTNHFWSLAVEEHFYCCWPLFLVLLTPRRALWVTPVLAICVHLWRASDAHWHIFPTAIFDAGNLHRTDTRIDAILWGCFAALLCSKSPNLRMPWWSAWTILGGLLGAVIFAAPALPLLLALLFPALVVSTAFDPRSALGRLLELGALRWVGRLSYSLYVWQTLFLQSSTSPDPAWLARLKCWPTNLCMIVLCGVASHYLLERPMIRIGKMVARRLIHPRNVEILPGRSRFPLTLINNTKPYEEQVANHRGTAP